jgi:hypothetical protein
MFTNAYHWSLSCSHADQLFVVEQGPLLVRVCVASQYVDFKINNQFLVYYLLGECLNSLRSLPLEGLLLLPPDTYFGMLGGGMRRLLSGDFPLVLKPLGERRDIRGGGGVKRQLGDLDRIILKK